MPDLTKNQQHYLRYKEYYNRINRERYEAKKLEILLKHKDYRDGWRHRVVTHLGGKCNHCGFEDPRALQIDHVVGGSGRADRAKQTVGFYKRVMADTSGKYQLLCANCNAIKRITNKEHAYGDRERVIYAD